MLEESVNLLDALNLGIGELTTLFGLVLLGSF